MAHAAWHAWVHDARPLCLDLRPAAAFDAGHLAHAVHVDGLTSLHARFSTLPPRDTPFLVVCAAAEFEAVATVFTPPERWSIVAVVGVDAIGTPRSPHPCFAVDHATWKQWACDAAMWRTTPSAERVTSADDAPHLLFRPAPAVARLLAFMDTLPHDATVLDVGCGAGRDVTFLLTEARQRHKAWRVTAIDRWRAALARAALLLNDHRLLAPSLAGASEPARAPPWAEAIQPCAIDANGHVVDEHGALPFADARLPHAAYDVVLLIRFWHPELLRTLPQRTRIGSVVVLSHFVHKPAQVLGAHACGAFATEYDAPPPASRIAPDAIDSLVALWNTSGTWAVLDNRIEPTEDGRPLQSVLLCRRA